MGDKFTIHVAKNFLKLPKIKVPLILGIWGGKGQGKTFQCDLAYKKLGINPTNVQLPGVYKTEEIPRVPIICTGNDFSTLYAPLIRDGRMEKFYWNPSREDRIGVATGI